MTRSCTLTVALAAAFLMGSADYSKADEANVITGKIVFKGKVDKFKRSKLKTAKDPNCKKSKKSIGSYDVIINKKTTPMTLRNVIVSIKEGLEGKVFPVKSGDVIIKQFGCEYDPHVIPMQEGQKLIVLNSDNTNHNIHFLPKANEAYNFTQPKKDMTKTLELKAEAPFKVKCDVHPWMGAYIGVFKHPFFDSTGKDGTFKLIGMPDGQYTIEAWHEKFGSRTIKVTVSGGQTITEDITFEIP